MIPAASAALGGGGLAPPAEVPHCQTTKTLGMLVFEVFRPVVATFQEEAGFD